MGSRQWPLLAARMDRIRDLGGTGALAAHLASLGENTAWKEGSSSTVVGRLVDATLRSLTTPPFGPAAPAARVRVSPAAARSRSTTTGTAPRYLLHGSAMGLPAFGSGMTSPLVAVDDPGGGVTGPGGIDGPLMRGLSTGFAQGWKSSP